MKRGGCLPGGCGSFILVFLLGGALSLFSAVFGLGVSVGVPFTESNVTAAGAIGTKATVTGALPDYARTRLGGNENFVNHSITVTVGPAEGVLLFVIGAQAGAPTVDLHVVLHGG